MPDSALAGQIWSDGDGDGLPDGGATLIASPGEVVSVDLWIDSQAFQWTNFLVYAEWEPACFTYVSAQYLLTDGANFPIDRFSHPSGVGFGGFKYDRSGVDAIGRVSLRLTAPVTCCVTPIIDPDNPYGVFSQLGQGKSYFLFTSNPGSCWDPTGTPQACCFPNGSCAELPPSQCAAQGGVFQGPGTTCASVSCPPPQGACCYPSGACTSFMTREACESGGGAYQGDGTDCATVSCPQPTGACCFDSGACSQLHREACEASGGAYQGDEVDCAAVNCPLPPAPTGACCLPSGFCLVRTVAECDSLGGDYRGDGVTCAAANCPQPTGACCLPNGTCLVRTAAQCSADGGIYQGNGVTCDSVDCAIPSQACCFSTDVCEDIEPAECLAQGGIPQGAGSTCATTLCPQEPVGACCVEDSCYDLTRAQCAALAGIYRGAGSSCEAGSCNSPPQCGSFSAPGSVALLRERFEPARARKTEAAPCLTAGNTNGTAANYRWYNVCSGYIWVYSGWVANEGVGTLFGGASQPAVSDGNDVKRVITYYRNVCPSYNQTVDVFLDNANSSGCLLSSIASDLNIDPGLRWNCSEVGARLCNTSGYVVVRTQHDGGYSPSFVTDGPISEACDPNSPARSFYYGLNGSACVPWVGPGNDSDNFLYWLILDVGMPCGSTAVEQTSWGKIKGLFR